MTCNHCTMCDHSAFYYQTRNGWICNECRDEIIAARRIANPDALPAMTADAGGEG
jgi:hypothetical protein